MNKKLICLVLALLMVVPVLLTGCATLGGNGATTGDDLGGNACRGRL